MKILIAVDESTHSERAVDFTARVGWPAGSRLIIVSAMRSIATVLANASTDTEIPVPDLQRQERVRVEAVVDKAKVVLRESGLPTEGLILEGDPREVLLQEIDKQRADLLVMGSHGRTGLTKLLLGSVSSHAVTHARCSVLVVKSPEDGEVEEAQ